MRGGGMVTRLALNQKIPGSIPGPAAILRQGYGVALKLFSVRLWNSLTVRKYIKK